MTLTKGKSENTERKKKEEMVKKGKFCVKLANKDVNLPTPYLPIMSSSTDESGSPVGSSVTLWNMHGSIEYLATFMSDSHIFTLQFCTTGISLLRSHAVPCHWLPGEKLSGGSDVGKMLFKQLGEIQTLTASMDVLH